MSNQNPAAYEGHAHFRVPADFMSQVHLVARRRGLTAAGFMRMAILDAIRALQCPMTPENQQLAPVSPLAPANATAESQKP